MERRRGVCKGIERKPRERGESLGNIEEFWKRKREESDEEKKKERGGPFQRSKRLKDLR